MVDIVGKQIDCLDKGFIKVVDTMGDDSAVVQAARTSYGEGTKTVNEDRGLIRYLMRHWHTTPFEMCEIKLHCKIPLFVARQWVRHRTANINEMSARYSILPNEFYIPDINQMKPQSMNNAQGRNESVDTSTDPEILEAQAAILAHSDDSYQTYEYLLGDGKETGVGLARELSRMVLPVNIYTEWYWKIDVHNLMHFMRLRCDPHAQYEVRVYADAMLALFVDWMPVTHEAFVDYRLEAVTLSRMEFAAIKNLLSEGGYYWEDMSDREIKEFETKFEI